MSPRTGALDLTPGAGVLDGVEWAVERVEPAG
jgi:hypothetical protein